MRLSSLGTDTALKAWYLLGPVTRFQVGTNVNYEIAQVDIEVTRDSESVFHVYRRPEVCIITLSYRDKSDYQMPVLGVALSFDSYWAIVCRFVS